MVVSEDDILVSVTIPQLIKDEFIKKGTFQLLPNGEPVVYTGGFAMVFPVVVDNKKWAFRCWRSTLSDLQQRYKYIWDYLKTTSLPYFCKGEFIEQGIVVGGALMPTSRMEWVDGIEIKDYVVKHKNQSAKIFALAEEFRKMCIDLHKNNISHGDLQHGNILICENRDGKPTLKLVDYDSLYVPTMGKKFKDSITGLKDYQHPARQTAVHVSSHKTDYFSELVIYLSLIAIAENPALCTKYEVKDRDALLFTLADFKDLYASKIHKDLLKLSENVQLHLNVLIDYLKTNDIEKLSPFTSLVDIDSILKDVKSKFATARRSNTIAAYKKFLNECPDTSYTKEYRDKAQDEIDKFNDIILWTSTIASGTLEAYTHYLENSQKLGYKTEAQNKIEELSWDKARRTGTEKEYRTYLKTSSTQEHALDAYLEIECLLYKAAIRNTSSASYTDYLAKSQKLRTEVDRFAKSYKKHSDLKYNEYLKLVSTCNSRITDLLNDLEDSTWASSERQGTTAAYELYLAKFPSGRYVTQCQARIEQIKANEYEEEIWKRARMGHSFTSYQNYLKNTTIGKHRQEARMGIAKCDEELWRKTINTNTKEAYQEYLKLAKSGKYRTAAEDKIKRLESSRRWKRIAIAALIVCSIIFIGRLIKSPVDTEPLPYSPPQITSSTPLSQPVNLASLEQEMLNKLTALELQKKNGKQLDKTIYNQTKNILNELQKNGSSKYQSYKIRFDKL